MDPASIASAFLLVTLAELGDKTQLAVITLSSRYSMLTVFVGAMLGFLAVDGLSVVAGATMLKLVPIRWVTFASGIVFIVFGIATLIPKKDDGIKIRKESRWPVFTSFSFVALNELGDKTHLATVALAAETSWDSVFFGVMTAFALLTAIAVVIGSKIVTRVPQRPLRIATAALFMFLGTVSVFSAIMDVTII